MTAFTIGAPDEPADKPDKVGRSDAHASARPINAYAEQGAWQLAELQAGLVEAETGDFAHHHELIRVIAKYARSA